MSDYRLGFIIEQTLGHITHGLNLQANVTKDPAVEAEWGFPVWQTTARLPLYKSNWTVQAGWQARQMVAAMHRQKPLDALFFHTQVTAVLSPDWLQRIPTIVSLDATPLQYDSLGQFYAHQSGPAWLEQLKWWLTRHCFRLAHHLVTWSEWTRQGLIAEYDVPPEKITVVPPGVNVLEWSHPTPRQLHNSRVKILFVGGDFERKGGLLLLDAFRTLRQQASELPEVELHLVTRTAVAPEPNVFVYNNLAANTPELKQLYQNSDIFCLPTYGDCLPMVLSEAGAAGLPTISTRVAAIPEVVCEAETGFLVEPGDGRSLLAALQRLVHDPSLRLQQGAQATDHIAQHFDAPANATRLLHLLKQIANH